jgi:hypothetical protein
MQRGMRRYKQNKARACRFSPRTASRGRHDLSVSKSSHDGRTPVCLTHRCFLRLRSTRTSETGASLRPMLWAPKQEPGATRLS